MMDLPDSIKQLGNATLSKASNKFVVGVLGLNIIKHFVIKKGNIKSFKTT